MKKITLLLTFVLLSFTKGKAQTFELGFGIGSGTAYLVENLDDGIDIDYSTPLSSYVDLKYSKSDKYFGAKLRLQYLNAGIRGSNWKGLNYNINGEVTSLTTLILLEHLKCNSKWNSGYNFGLGYTNQTFKPDLVNSINNIESTYLSINISGILNRKINENFSFQIEPNLMWTDPINSLRNREKWQIAGEDISMLIQLGLTYRIN
ncbi:hypothetical protein [Autumnicola musiva]|uniref:Outer membrane protein beta-barrel domain-containing protein n=1 Tax=Autumnicola musiva TaxID=3075589 RepID=A0ABU3D5A6_9FLAO|nr:hypothetical protein [Zunongwangia sp. F117]MDT0676711.1 hypothetical protein [Zunongwangia sp. F117]